MMALPVAWTPWRSGSQPRIPVRHCDSRRLGHGTSAPYTDGPDGLSRCMRNRIIASQPHKIIGLFHSFGGGYGVFFNQWLANWYSGPNHDNPPFKFDLAVFFNPVPNGLLAQGRIPAGRCRWQRPRCNIAPARRNGIVVCILGSRWRRRRTGAGDECGCDSVARPATRSHRLAGSPADLFDPGRAGAGPNPGAGGYNVDCLMIYGRSNFRVWHEHVGAHGGSG